MAKDYTKYQKTQPEKSSDSGRRSSAFNIKAPFRSNPDGTESRDIQIHKVVNFKGKSPFNDYIGTERFETLVRDIDENGVLTPIIVRAMADGNYEILAGHHRTAAAKYLHLATIPAIVYPIDTSDDKAMLIHINTNILNGRDQLRFIEKVQAMVAYESTLEKQQGLRSDRKSNSEKFDRYQHLAEVFHIGNKTTAIQYVKAGKEMPQDILLLIDSQSVPFSVAYKILTQDNSMFKEELFDYLRQGKKLTLPMLEKLILEYKERSRKGTSQESEKPEENKPAEENAVPAAENAYDGFQTMDEFDVTSAPSQGDSFDEKEVPNRGVPAKKSEKEPLLKASEFDNIIDKGKKKKVVNLKVEKTLIPSRFLALDDEKKSDIIISLLRDWDQSFPT